MFRKCKRSFLLFLTGILLISCFSYRNVYAKSKPYISAKKLTLTVNKTKTLSIRKNRKKVTWKSSNKKIVIVSQRGKVKAKKPGHATITAYIGKKKFTCRVTVKSKKAATAKIPANANNSTNVTSNPDSSSETTTQPASNTDKTEPTTSSSAKETSVADPNSKDDGWLPGWY